MAQTADLDSTISALQGGLTSVPPEAALANIESWQQQLQGAAPEIAKVLGEIKSQLSSGNASGAAIGKLLTQAGSEASKAGASAEGDAGKKLQQLGQLLTQAGSSLS